MSVVEIRKTKTREPGPGATALRVGTMEVRGPPYRYRSLRRVPVCARVSRECPGSLPCLFTGPNKSILSYRYSTDHRRVPGTMLIR